MHCPQCGVAHPIGARACLTCGAALTPAANEAPARAHTMLGTFASSVASAGPRTIVGRPAAAPASPGRPEVSAERTPLGAAADAGAPGGSDRVQASPIQDLGAPAAPPRAALAWAPSGRTGVEPAQARGGEVPPDPLHELGATIGPHIHPVAWSTPRARAARPEHRPRARVLAVAERDLDRAPARKVLAAAAAGAFLLIGSVSFALFWPRSLPLAARARTDARGREVVEIRCVSCPDGTRISVGDATATVATAAGELVPSRPLAIGDNLLRFQVDRPASGRDEAVDVHVNVAYRIRPDLSPLQRARPSIQIAVEAVDGTTVALDGKPVALVAGRATETIDVSDACTGLSDETTALTRQIHYTILPRGGDLERGTINVSVPHAALRIDAPGSQAVIDGPSFVLAGRATRGADVLAAGRPIHVRPDGTFAHTMNVSAVGATQIEVRAQLAGGAPRLTHIPVRRVSSLATVAREFAAQSPAPLGYAAIAGDMSSAVGKAAIVTGEVIEIRALAHQHQTFVLLSVSPAGGCVEPSDECRVRLVRGALTTLSRGDVITAYGTVAAPYAGAARPPIPELQVDFTTKGNG